METSASVLRKPVDSPDFTETRPASIERVAVAEPGREEVLVEVTAASLCHTDVASARGHIEEACPLVMGHEGAGVVRAVGDGVGSVEPGDHVVLGRITCGRCAQCRAGAGQQCVERVEAAERGTLRGGAVRFSLDGEPVHHYHGVSSFAEHTVVNEEVAISVPAELPPEQATLLGCGVFTGAGAVMNTVDVGPGSTVVVFGAGGVGLSAVQGARIRGATTVVAVDLVAEKLAVAAEVGATHTVDASGGGSTVEAIAGVAPDGVDVAVEAVGHERVLADAVEVVDPRGAVVLVGVPAQGVRDVPIDLFDVVRTEKSLVGSFNGSYSLPLAVPMLADLAVAGDLLLEPMVTDVRPLAEVNEAMEALETGTDVRQVLVP